MALARGLRVLLVEDNPDDVDLTVAAFRETGAEHQVDVVENGVEALAYLRRQGAYHAAPTPDLVLLDLNLPKQAGHELLATVKNDAALRSIPVVVLTSSKADADVERTYAAGANAYVTKPADLDELFRVVHAIDAFWRGVARLPTALTTRST